MQGYVNEANDRAEQVKRYLINKHGIEVDRIAALFRSGVRAKDVFSGF
jgi:hypothetical protein